jgi:pseudouridine-5'-phosphate glycosidase
VAATSPDPAAIVLSDEVADALTEGRPVVALESTIVAHGLPRPRNLEVARALEDMLRAQGVTPATTAVLDGRAHVGLTATELERIAESDAVHKASVRDLPVAVALGLDAATTVASTATLAHASGIRVFATGGLGGVHRGATTTFDESADLTVLARVPIVVVAAGVKSILDVPATLERLETLSVTVVGYRTTRFPGFYVTDSGLDLDWSVEGPEDVAALRAAADAAGLPGAVLVANPVDPGSQLDPDLHDRALADALAAAARTGVSGKEVTPFLLARMLEVTGGASLEANVAAVTGNVALAGRIARAWTDRRAA